MYLNYSINMSYDIITKIVKKENDLSFKVETIGYRSGLCKLNVLQINFIKLTRCSKNLLSDYKIFFHQIIR